MRRLIPFLTADDPAVIGNRDRRKAYYHGKYAKEVSSAIFLFAIILFCLVRLNS